jgi:hypothetical protein
MALVRRSALEVAGLVVRAETRGDGVRVVLSAATTFALRLRVTRPAACTLDGSDDGRWPLWRGLPVASNRADPFQRAVSWAWVALTTGRPGQQARAPVLRRLYAELRALAVHAADRCDTDARPLALRFLPHARWFVYERVVGDRTGRIAQLATACPGALLLALALRDCDRPGGIAASERLLGGVVAGRRLPGLLDEALEFWLHAGGHSFERRHDEPWVRLRLAPQAERRRLLQQQRLLVRRASSRVPTTLLWLPPPVVFCPEDLPATARGQATWFRAMKSLAFLAPHPRLDAGAQAALSSFCSRHAEALYEIAGRTQFRGVIHWILDYVAATGRVPARNSSPARVVADVRRWHAAMARVADMAALAHEVDAARALADVCETTELPTAPNRAWSGPGVDVRPLGTVGELIAEGHELRHCVASYVGAVLSGAASIYSATVDGERLTVELRARRGEWRIGQVAGATNRPPTAAEMLALRRWLAGAAPDDARR